MDKVRAKKNLGQHFLTDLNIAKDIAEGLQLDTYTKVLEVGPGMGVLTQFLLPQENKDIYVAEIDTESVAYLNVHFPQLAGKIITGDFLRMDMREHFGEESYAVIGNFPYNISSQIFFNVFYNRNKIPEVVGMLQKEVAERIASKNGSKKYGILSVLLQAFYDIEYMFTVHEDVFDPPPRVKSGVIRMKRNNVKELACDEKKFIQVVKQGFNNRRKTLRNALKPLNLSDDIRSMELLDKRAEQLTVDEFVGLTKKIEESQEM